jgi:hypothetical protein
MPAQSASPGLLLVAVQDHIFLFSDNSSELDTFARVLPRHTLEVFNESLFAVSDGWVVLNVYIASIALDRIGRLALIEH